MNCTATGVLSLCTFLWIFRFPSLTAWISHCLSLGSSVFLSFSFLPGSSFSPALVYLSVLRELRHSWKLILFTGGALLFTALLPPSTISSSHFCPHPPFFPRTGTRFILNKCKRRVNWQTMKKEKYFCTFIVPLPSVLPRPWNPKTRTTTTMAGEEK